MIFIKTNVKMNFINANDLNFKANDLNFNANDLNINAHDLKINVNEHSHFR